jgi:hypothetical protein
MFLLLPRLRVVGAGLVVPSSGGDFVGIGIGFDFGCKEDRTVISRSRSLCVHVKLAASELQLPLRR